MTYIALLMTCLAGVYMLYKEELAALIQLEWIRARVNQRKQAIEFLIVRKNKSRIDKELFNSSVILKNMSLVQRQTPFSADYMYEKLMENSVILKPVYSQMLNIYRSRQSSEAFKLIPLTLGTRASKSFALILSKLDKLNPAELEEQMEVFQKSMMDNRMTYAIKRVQRSSMILTALSTVTVFVLLLNFVVVVVFLNTIDTLNQIFV